MFDAKRMINMDLNKKCFNLTLRSKLNILFQQVITFLDSNNIRWSVGCGTAIGAVRHKGIIPWDDDIDVWMPREDYNRLLTMRPSLQTLNMDIISMENSESYWLPFAKVFDVNTTIWEYANTPCVFGLYIDIFPFDSIWIRDEDKISYYKEIKSLQKKLQLKRSKISFGSYIDLLKGGHIGTIYAKAIDDIKRMLISDSVVEKLSSKEKVYLSNTPNCTVMLSATVYRHCYFPFGTFEKYMRIPFEDYDVSIISGYDTVLTLMYGDYMTPPPLEQQVLTHESQRYYCNLKEGLTLDEVKERIKQGEHLVF